MLVVVRRSAVKARTQAINQLHALVVTAPDQVKHQLRGLSPKARVKVCAKYRPGAGDTTIRYAKQSLRLLARRYQTLTTEVKELTTDITRLCTQANPALMAAPGVGADTAAALLVAAGDNPQRMKAEASFAALCGVSPVKRPQDAQYATASTAAATAKPTTPYGASPPPGHATTNPQSHM